LLITGFDILFFWVARMMMMGIYVMKDVPFKDVYLHALVRDEKGEKMSKSKGNSIDPILMIDQYGTDAFRFTLAAYTAQGRDVRLSPERIEGYKFFVNKIWNASKLTLGHLDDFDESAASGDSDSLPDKWIRVKLNKATEDITLALDEYRFNDAAAAVYRFIWHELCDWYLELSKPVFYGKENPEQRQAAQRTLHEVYQKMLQLLHPFMPFLTEELWQILKGSDENSIMVSKFPVVNAQWADMEAEKEMEMIMEIITSIRNIRGEMRIAPSQKLKVFISAADEKNKKSIVKDQGYILNLANLESLAVEINMVEPKGVATAVMGATKIFVPLAGAVDISAEKARLEKELGKVSKDLEQCSKKLANRDFCVKAAPEIIQKEEEKLKDLQKKFATLEGALKKLKGLSL
jgi:valyl-tRNA synthetase